MAAVRLVTVFSLALTSAAHAQSASRSVGHRASGRLVAGVELTDGPSLCTYERRARYGTDELVALLNRATRAVCAAHAETVPLTVGDLSRRRGGRLPPHRSHRGGRDADVGYYLLDDAGRPLALPRFVRIRRDLTCRTPDGRPCRLDVARTWRLMAEIAREGGRVQQIFLAGHIRRALFDEARRVGAPDPLLRRFRLMSLPATQSEAHVTHFHVRVYCAEDDRPGCVDPAPHHPWYRFPEGTDPQLVRDAQARTAQLLADDRAREARIRARLARWRERRATERRVATRSRRRSR